MHDRLVSHPRQVTDVDLVGIVRVHLHSEPAGDDVATLLEWVGLQFSAYFVMNISPLEYHFPIEQRRPLLEPFSLVRSRVS